MKQNKFAVLGLFISFILILIGLWQQQNQIVFTKAIKICLECIGLG